LLSLPSLFSVFDEQFEMHMQRGILA